jgi:hypothetical protein
LSIGNRRIARAGVRHGMARRNYSNFCSCGELVVTG